MDLESRGIALRVAETKALISFAVTAKLTFVFVFVHAKRRFLTTRLKYMEGIRFFIDLFVLPSVARARGIYRKVFKVSKIGV